MNNLISFRKAQLHEGSLLTELSLRSKSFWGYTSEYLEKCRPYLTIDKDYIARWPVVVIEKEDKILGYYSLKVIRLENRLDNLWLDLPYIGHGIGRIALIHATECAKQFGWNHFFLASEPNSVSFYIKCGGIYVGEVESKLEVNLKLPHIKFIIK